MKLFLLERGNKLKWRGKTGRGDIIQDIQNSKKKWIDESVGGGVK